MIINKNLETSNVLIFLRLPKTGSCTLNSIIRKQYDKNYYNIIRSFTGIVPWSKYLDEEEKKRLEVLSGHFHFGIHKSLPQKRFTYITLIRNPIERVISFYYYGKSNKHHPNHEFFCKTSLYEFVKKDKRASNQQTLMLSGKYKSDLEAAIDNFKKYFSVVGVTERYDESLYVLKNKFNWKIDNYKNLNITPNRPSIKDLPKEIIEIIKTKNKIDFKLYEFANKYLDEQLQNIKK